jgi:hypothetical protein
MRKMISAPALLRTSSWKSDMPWLAATGDGGTEGGLAGEQSLARWSWRKSHAGPSRPARRIRGGCAHWTPSAPAGGAMRAPALVGDMETPPAKEK